MSSNKYDHTDEDPFTPVHQDVKAGYVIGEHLTDTSISAAFYDAAFERFVAQIKSEAWDDAIDFVSRHYEDYLPLNWQSRADEESPRRIEDEA